MEKTPRRGSYYQGRCAVCGKEARAELFFTGEAKILSPPQIHGCCYCQLPVVPVILTYAGPILP